MSKKSASVVISLSFLLLGYFLSAFFKISASIVMPYYQQQMGLNSAMIGLLSGTFFFPYALGQLFGGALCIRYGSHRVMSLGFFAASVGTVLFAFAATPFHLGLGRICMGLGVGPSFLCVINYLQENYTKEEYAKISGFSVMFFNFGGAVASAPLKWMLDAIGLKALFLIFSVVQIAMIICLTVSEKNYHNHAVVLEKTSTIKQLSCCLHTILASPFLVGCSVIWCCFNLFVVFYQGLWGSLWTVTCFPEGGDIGLFCGTSVAFGIMIGSLFSDRLKLKKKNRVETVSFDIWLTVVMFAMLTVCKVLGSSKLLLWNSLLFDFLYGMTVGMICVQETALIRENTDPQMNPVILGIMCCFTNVVAQPMQWLSGVLVDFFSISNSLNTSFVYLFSMLSVLFFLAVVYSVKKIKNIQ